MIAAIDTNQPASCALPQVCGHGGVIPTPTAGPLTAR
jgi:hypothetical protein